MASEQINIELLRSFSPLDGLKQDNLVALAGKIQIREMSPGQILFKEGDTEKRSQSDKGDTKKQGQSDKGDTEKRSQSDQDDTEKRNQSDKDDTNYQRLKCPKQFTG